MEKLIKQKENIERELKTCKDKYLELIREESENTSKTNNLRSKLISLKNNYNITKETLKDKKGIFIKLKSKIKKYKEHKYEEISEIYKNKYKKIIFSINTIQCKYNLQIFDSLNLYKNIYKEIENFPNLKNQFEIFFDTKKRILKDLIINDFVDNNEIHKIIYILKFIRQYEIFFNEELLFNCFNEFINKRYEYHFLTDKETNRLDKAEWIFNFLEKKIDEVYKFKEVFDNISIKDNKIKNDNIKDNNTINIKDNKIKNDNIKDNNTINIKDNKIKNDNIKDHNTINIKDNNTINNKNNNIKDNNIKDNNIKDNNIKDNNIKDNNIKDNNTNNIRSIKNLKMKDIFENIVNLINTKILEIKELESKQKKDILINFNYFLNIFIIKIKKKYKYNLESDFKYFIDELIEEEKGNIFLKLQNIHKNNYKDWFIYYEDILKDCLNLNKKYLNLSIEYPIDNILEYNLIFIDSMRYINRKEIQVLLFIFNKFEDFKEYVVFLLEEYKQEDLILENNKKEYSIHGDDILMKISKFNLENYKLIKILFENDIQNVLNLKIYFINDLYNILEEYKYCKGFSKLKIRGSEMIDEYLTNNILLVRKLDKNEYLDLLRVFSKIKEIFNYKNWKSREIMKCIKGIFEKKKIENKYSEMIYKIYFDL